MVRKMLLLWILVSPVWLPAQETPASLAARLTEGEKSDAQKVSAIFRWITGNISYTIRKPVPHPLPLLSDTADNTPLLPLNERVARQVLQRGAALCDGYARLFAALCSHAGIRAEIVKGYARPRSSSYGDRFGINHYWNAVWLEGRWKLLDVTWASGYLTRAGDRFIPAYDDYYYLTPPAQFIEDHYPDDINWTLLPETRIPHEFSYSPFRQAAFPKYGIREYSPRKGILVAAPGDTLQFRLKLGDWAAGRQIGAATCEDTLCFPQRPGWVIIGPKPAPPGATHIEYELPLGNSLPEWICLQYNGDLVLRYRVVGK